MNNSTVLWVTMLAVALGACGAEGGDYATDAGSRRDVPSASRDTGSVDPSDSDPDVRSVVLPHTMCTPDPSCPAGATLTGRVFAPNGTDPISNAMVYIPSGDVAPFSTALTCDLCQTNIAGCTYATSGPDGSFTLTGAPIGSRDIIIEKGRFRRRAHLEITCGTASLPAETTRLPRNNTEGELPRIAVANGDYDKLECVLRKIGVDAGAIDIYNLTTHLAEPGRPSFETLLRNRAMMNGYNVIFINCSDPLQYLTDASVISNIREYVASGGRLYITDQSYDHIAHVPEWSSMVCWEGASCPSDPPVGVADIGQDGLETDATVDDPDLARWLHELGATNADGTVHLTHFLAGWAMQHSHGIEVKQWMSGPVASDPDSPLPGISGVRPLTITFDYNHCGRVLYSSYHTLGRETDTCGDGGTPCHFPNYCDSSALSPQERVLEYLIFEISTCVQEPG